MLAALLFAAVLAVEHAYVLFQPAPAYYRALRVRLTLVAVACLLACVVC